MSPSLLHAQPARAAADEALRRAWYADAFAANTLVARICRLAMDLESHGAPETLVDGTHYAALGARALCQRALANAGSNAALPLPTLEGPVAQSLASVAERALVELSLAGSLVAELAEAAAMRAADDESRQAHRATADEAWSRAELGFSVLEWAVAEGGHEVADTLAAAIAKVPVSRKDLEAHLQSLADEARLRAFAQEAIDRSVESYVQQRARNIVADRRSERMRTATERSEPPGPLFDTTGFASGNLPPIECCTQRI